ncbi:hypothetical protein [Chryseobacterium gambrini]|uniref:hypothetical protein n=1 Tax=Chryseobacterium gambrini TaxID=373672 RepID=UPI003D125CA1
MTELISAIDEIIKYGMESNVKNGDKEKSLERNLVKIYLHYFEIVDPFDSNDYPKFDKSKLPDIRKNIIRNFSNFGFYKTACNIRAIDNTEDLAIEDAVDDLNDIILDLTETKWRIENNSLSDGLWFFKFIFESHTQQHILNLLNYMKQNS